MAKRPKQTSEDGAEITVRLMGKVGELAKSAHGCDPRGAELTMRLPIGGTSPRDIIARVADENPLLRDQMVRADGSPRSSTRILLNGKPPRDLDQKLEIRRDPQTRRLVIVIILTDGTVIVITDVVIIVFVPCDG
jgi:hypothetical protein